MLEESLKCCKYILHLHLRPWLLGKESGINFTKHVRRLKPIPLDKIPLYEVSLDTPLTPKIEFYQRIIEMGFKEYLNEIHEEMEEAVSDNEKAYILHEALSGNLHMYLSDCSRVIKLYKEWCEPMEEDTYILEILKHHLVWMYEEIQDNYINHLTISPLRSDELYPKYFKHPEPSPPRIVGAILSPEMEFRRQVEIPQITTFQPILRDFRPVNEKVFAYNQIVKDPAKFAKVEETLFEEDLLDQGYNFINKYGNHQHMAAAYHQMIDGGYFHQRVFPENVEVKPIDLMNFLNHRYQADLGKQFRTWASSPQKLKTFIESKFWLDQFSPCLQK